MLKPGDTAPEIDAVASDGKQFRLSEQRPKLCTIVYFFPKAFTPGCALETKHFRENYAELRLAGAGLVGVSTDDHDTQCMFAASLRAPFPMIGDKDKRITRAYDVLWPMLGMARRVTYIVNPMRTIEAVFHHEINIGQHRNDVLQVMDRMRSARARPAAPSLPAMPSSDPYELLGEAGSGGMGVVYRARERDTGRVVAVKILSATGDMARFVREAVLLSRIQHPNIVSYVAHGTTPDGRFYLVMEWLDGASLSEHLGHGKLSVAESVRLAKEIAKALVAAHDNGVIHRDIKPSNILLTQDDRVKLVDLGIARPTENISTKLTRTGHLVGTPGYAAPEQIRSAEIDVRADIFALGCVIYRCISGRAPFDGRDSFSVLYATLYGELAPIEDAPPALAKLVGEMLSREPAGRPESAAVVLSRLESL